MARRKLEVAQAMANQESARTTGLYDRRGDQVSLTLPTVINFGVDIPRLFSSEDGAIIGLMVYTFARVGAALKMRAEDVYVQGVAPGCDCTRRAASNTRCLAITTWRTTSMPTSKVAG